MRRGQGEKGVAQGRGSGAGAGGEGAWLGDVSAPISAALRLRCAVPCEALYVCVPPFGFQQPLLFSPQSPAEVRLGLTAAAQAEALPWPP